MSAPIILSALCAQPLSDSYPRATFGCRLFVTTAMPKPPQRVVKSFLCHPLNKRKGSGYDSASHYDAHGANNSDNYNACGSRSRFLRIRGGDPDSEMEKSGGVVIFPF